VRAGPVIRIPTHRPPTHPGDMLLEEFLTPMGLSQRELAEALHVPYQRINEIVNGAALLVRLWGLGSSPSPPSCTHRPGCCS